MWKECVKSGQMKAAIARDRSDGERFGVTGTPTFFDNGIRLVGAHPFENFKQVIDEELKRAGVK
jgi:protein-disulfide isomerase